MINPIAALLEELLRILNPYLTTTIILVALIGITYCSILGYRLYHQNEKEQRITLKKSFIKGVLCFGSVFFILISIKFVMPTVISWIELSSYQYVNNFVVYKVK